ncbi:recombinase RecT [Mycobacteroides abscessus]|uniref:recombinase RecT n=1 Tax=Mycobacteroides abscessus TaxID=36809 RepID=UPI0012FFF1FB|nr:recombinase RecT [Mycobacteroides abscessus]
MTNEIQTVDSAQVVPATDTALAIAADQTEFNQAQIAALKQLGVEDAPRGDLDVFFHTAKRTGLDPFSKQIYMIGRNTKVGGYGGAPERWETKYTIQTGIEGYRVVGHRIARREVIGRPFARRLFCGRDGVWRDVLIENGPPVAAKAEITCDGVLVGEAVVKFVEYAQTTRAGELVGQWRDKPTVMIGKCAEAAAWRAAFPQDFAGVYEPAEFDRHQVIDGEVEPVRVRAERADRGVQGVAAALGIKTETVDAEAPSPSEPTPEAPAVELITPAQSRKLYALLRERGLEDKDAALAWISSALSRTRNPVASTRDLTKTEATTLIDILESDRAEQPTTTEGNE